MDVNNIELSNKLKQYLETYKPIGELEIFNIKQILNGNSSNHLNYKIVTSKGKFLIRIVVPENSVSNSNLADEYTILKLLESYKIAPKGVAVDLEYFESPLLIEEFIEGEIFSDIKNAPMDVLDKVIDLVVRTSNVKINSSDFPFKFMYTTYDTNIKTWRTRIEEISNSLKINNLSIEDFKKVISEASSHLEENDMVLRESKHEFIYNDVHPGNIIYTESNGDIRFIDWQKVSIGDPSFMVALLARRFAHIWNINESSFIKEILHRYALAKEVVNLDILFRTRILERAVSDMVWSVWSNVKSGKDIEINKATDNKYYNEATRLLDNLKLNKE